MSYEAMDTVELVGLLVEQACIYYTVDPGEERTFRSCPLCDKLMSAMNARGLDYDHSNSAVYELAEITLGGAHE